MEERDALLRLIPGPPDWNISWTRWRETALERFFEKLERTPQDPLYHGEGDAWTHTRMVCEALAAREDFRRRDAWERQTLFLAALLHDVGKISCTKMEDGRWTSPHHAAVGAAMAREALWVEYGWCGEPAWQELRETVCTLIRYHTLPLHAVFAPDGSQRVLRAASNGELLPRFHMELLCLLAEADVEGRACADRQEQLEAAALCGAMAEELSCRTGPRRFLSDYAAFASLNGGMAPPDYELYDGTWGEVLLLSGLPGTGKDTWIAGHRPDLPVVSLDDIRLELGIPPAGPQGRVIDEARERGRALLRNRQPFVWNATDLTPAVRQKQVALLASYGASVRIVYLETPWAEQLRRNAGRAAAVPEAVISRMLSKLTPPERFEAHRVEWRCI